MPCPLSDDEVRRILETLPTGFDTLRFIAKCPQAGGEAGTGCEVVRWQGRGACGVRLGAWQRMHSGELSRTGSGSPARWRQATTPGGPSGSGTPTPHSHRGAPPTFPAGGTPSSPLDQRLARIERQLADLSIHVRAAQSYLQSDPQSSLTKSRIVLERVVLDLYRRTMASEPRRFEAGEMLNNHQFTRGLPRRIVALLNSIRDMANLGAHGEEVTDRDARRVFEDLLEVIDWYFQQLEGR